MALTLAEARQAVETEQCECIAEREAFERFRTAVARVDSGRGTQSTAVTTATSGVHPGMRAPAGRVLTASSTSARPSTDSALAQRYRQSVMAVGTPTEESVADHIAAELGPDLARAVREGPLNPDSRRALLDRVGVAIDARDSFCAVLDRESESLDRVEEACDRVRARLRRVSSWESESMSNDERLDAALAAWDDLDDLASELDDAASDRQETLVRHRRSLAALEGDVTDYLYGERPGLAAIASVGQTLVTARESVVDAVGRPVSGDN